MGANLKFIHCSDLHLGSRFVGISCVDPKLGKRLSDSTFQSFKRIIDTAISEKVDLMIISGDVFNEENETPSTRYRFAAELKRLSIPCFISLGNHDFKRSWEQSIPYPSNVHVFSNDPESQALDIEGNKIEIIGRSFSSKHIRENIAASLRGSSDAFTIAVVHCSLDSLSGDDRYAPCRLSDLLGKNVDYWALGHIHKRSIEYQNPHIVYPGNIQGLNSKESGEKGAYIINVRNGTVSEARFFPTQEILWQDLHADITNKTYSELLQDLASRSKKDSILSVTIAGKGQLDSTIRLDPEGFKEQLSVSTGCTISSIDVQTSPEIDISSKGSNDLISKLSEASDSVMALPRKELIDLICSTRISSDIRYIFEGMSDDDLRSVVKDAEMLLIEMLYEESS